MVRKMYFDNRINFVGANNELKEVLQRIREGVGYVCRQGVSFLQTVHILMDYGKRQ